MNTHFRTPAAVWLVVVAMIAASFRGSQAEDPRPADDSKSPAASIPAVNPKPLSETTQRGIAYLIDQQQPGGGWGQGGGWRQNAQGGGRVEGANVSDPPDLGNTCIATLALIRAGNTPQTGPYAQNVARAAALICDYVERSDNDSLYATDVRDTQLQSKIGRYVDTFLAGLVLSELKGKMPADGSDKRVLAALDKTVRKIEKNQGADGNFAGNTGWASVLSQAVCSKFINRAAQAQVAVKAEVLERDFDSSVASLDLKTGRFAGAGARVAATPALAAKPAVGGRLSGLEPGKRVASEPVAAGGIPSDAGVNLYAAASNASRINDLGNTSAIVEQRAKNTLASTSATREEKEKARADLKQVDEVRGAQLAAVNGIARQLGDKEFIAGFGNNGGEEFLSYMNISEMLVVKGGAEWENWDKSISANLGRVQNQDGSWSGQHCITGRTFCTAAALLTLMADRAPVPLAAKISENRSR
jgi:hypothetical protein